MNPVARKARRGRPKHAREKKIAQIVKRAAASGHSHKRIAEAVRLNPRTLRTYYAKELQRGAFEMLLEVEAAHFKSALDGNVTAKIHILACKGGRVNPNRVRKVAAPSSPPVKKWDEVVVRVGHVGERDDGNGD